MSSKAAAGAKAAAPKGKGKAAASVSSSSASDSSSDDEPQTKKKVAAAKPAPKKKAAAVSSSSDSDSESEDEKPKKKAAAAAKKAPAKKKAVSSSESDSDSEEESRPAKKKPAAKAAPKTAAKAAAAPKKAANAFAGLSDEESSAASDQSDDESDDEEETASKKPAAAAAAAKGKAAPAAAPAKAAKGKAAAADEADDLDAILNDLSLGGAPTDESKMTKAQLKRLRQKQKQEAEKNAPADAAAAAPAADEEKKESAAAKKKAKEAEKAAAAAAKAPAKAPANKAVEALKEKLRAQKEEEERRRREEEARLAAIEAERIRLEEEERLAAEERERKLQARSKAREEARKAGALLSKTEKAAQAKREAFLKQLELSGAKLPAALQAKVAGGEGAAAADGAAGEAAADGAEKPKENKKKDAIKKKSAFGKRLEAQKEADRIRAERHAAEDKSRVAAKEEEARRKAEDEAIAAKHAAAVAALDDEEGALDVETPPEVSSAEEEDVADSWEDVDSEEDRRKATEKEERRKARTAARQTRIKAKAAARAALAKKRDDLARQAEAEAAEIKKQRQQVDEQRKRKADEALKAQKEEDRQAQAVAAGFEIAASSPSAEDSVSPSGGGSSKADKRKGAGDLRSPIACILGHVDTGKTKILDNIRKSSVQAGEAGGITQQIGATFIPRANIIERTTELAKFLGKELRMDMPGLLCLDTPGHESFTNLRSRGSNLCDIAILVIDLMHGLEPQTIESIGLLKARKTPFIIALNKVDRCYGWKSMPNAPFQVTFNSQKDSTQSEFEKRAADAILLMAEQGLNCQLYYKNPDFRKWISVVPTSAITGEGIPDLLMLLTQLTQNLMNERLSYVSELSCTVLEVKVVEGLGTTIDVILVNGVLQEGDTIVVCGMNGPIVTTIRALLTPPPMHEIRVKSEYVHHKLVKAAMGVKISAQGLETAIAGSTLLVCKKGDDIEEMKDEVQGDLATILSKVDKSGQGVAVQASTLGSLEALLSFMADMKIPVSSISIGPVFKKDVMKAAVMLEKKPEYGVMLCFDVKVSPDAAKLADEMGVKIFTADIIYHLYDSVTKYMAEVREKKRGESADVAVFPCVLDILPNSIFNVKSPIVLGVRVVEGVARVGTPICIPSKSFLVIGRITGIQKNHTDFQEAKKGEEFACKIEQSKSDQQIVFGRHFDASSQLVSKITRESIDLLKANFKDDLSEADWRLVVKLKKVFDIV